MANTNIRELRKERGLSIEALAFDTNISVSQISRFENDERDPRLSELRRIAKRLSVNVPSLIGEGEATDVPLISWVSAGQLVEVPGVTDDMILGIIAVPGLPAGDWVALRTSGDSMDRIAPDGSTILVNRLDRNLVSNKFYVFHTERGETTFKRYRSNPDRFTPYSTNPDHETIYPSGPVVVFGRVWRVISDLT